MKEAINNFHAVSSYYADMLNNTRQEILERVRYIVTDVLGGRVCLLHYHEWDSNTVKYTYFEVDGDGYGRELEADTVVTDENGKIGLYLSDNDGGYTPYWELSDLTATDALYLLEELERVVEYMKENGEEEVVKDYDPNYCPEDY